MAHAFSWAPLQEAWPPCHFPQASCPLLSWPLEPQLLHFQIRLQPLQKLRALRQTQRLPQAHQPLHLQLLQSHQLLQLHPHLQAHPQPLQLLQPQGPGILQSHSFYFWLR